MFYDPRFRLFPTFWTAKVRIFFEIQYIWLTFLPLFALILPYFHLFSILFSYGFYNLILIHLCNKRHNAIFQYVTVVKNEGHFAPQRKSESEGFSTKKPPSLCPLRLFTHTKAHQKTEEPDRPTRETENGKRKEERRKEEKGEEATILFSTFSPQYLVVSKTFCILQPWKKFSTPQGESWRASWIGSLYLRE